MAEKANPKGTPGLPALEMGPRPGLGGGRSEASPFSLKQKPMYEVWQKANSFGPAKKVSTARTKQGARNAVDRWDNKYGSYVHYHKLIGE